MKEVLSLTRSNIKINYSKFIEYLKEKKAYDHRENMEFLLKKKNKTTIISFLVSLEEARNIWKPSEGTPSSETYWKAVKLLLGEWGKYFLNEEGEYIVDPNAVLKGILNKYAGFIRQEYKTARQEYKKRILNTLLQESSKNTPLYQAPITEIEKIKKNIKSLSPETKKVIQKFGLQYIVDLIYSYKTVQFINKTTIPEDTNENYNDVDDIYRRPSYGTKSILYFEDDFIKQFKDLINEQHNLNNNQIKEIIKEIDSYIQLESNEERIKRQKMEELERKKEMEELERKKEIEREIDFLEKQFNGEKYGDPEVWTRIVELKGLL